MNSAVSRIFFIVFHMFSAENVLYLVIVRLGENYCQFVKIWKCDLSAGCDVLDMNDVFLFHKWEWIVSLTKPRLIFCFQKKTWTFFHVFLAGQQKVLFQKKHVKIPQFSYRTWDRPDM